MGPEPMGGAERRTAMLHLTITRPDRTTARIALGGDLDREGIDALTRLTGSLAPTGLRRVVLDLAGLVFVDLAGWRAFQAACATLADRGLDAAVVDESPVVRRVRTLLDSFSSG